MDLLRKNNDSRSLHFNQFFSKKYSSITVAFVSLKLWNRQNSENFNFSKNTDVAPQLKIDFFKLDKLKEMNPEMSIFTQIIL